MTGVQTCALPISGSTPRGRSDQSGPSPRGRPHVSCLTSSDSRTEARRSWFDVGPGLLPPRAGLLHEGRDLLAKGCAYCTKAPPTRSTPIPPPVAPHPRALRPDDAGSHPNDCEQPGQPSAGKANNGNQDRSTRPPAP